MALFATTRSTDGPRLHRDPMPQEGGDDAAGVQLLPPHVVDPQLPRHVLVALAAIIADVSCVRQRQVDDRATPDPELQASLDSILGKLDGLVDSIYGRPYSRV